MSHDMSQLILTFADKCVKEGGTQQKNKFFCVRFALPLR
jgi:hypothetical protein